MTTNRHQQRGRVWARPGGSVIRLDALTKRRKALKNIVLTSTIRGSGFGSGFIHAIPMAQRMLRVAKNCFPNCRTNG